MNLQCIDYRYFRSRIDVVTNQRILFLFFVLIALALISAVGAYVFDHIWLMHAYYLGPDGLFCFSQNHYDDKYHYTIFFY